MDQRPLYRFVKPCDECGQKDCDGGEDCPAGPVGLADIPRWQRERELRRQREALHEGDDE